MVDCLLWRVVRSLGSVEKVTGLELSLNLGDLRRGEYSVLTYCCNGAATVAFGIINF